MAYLAYPQYQVVTGNTITVFTDAVATASVNGWLVVGAASVSGSGFMVLMTRGVGAPLPITDTTQSLSSAIPIAPTGSGIWQNVFPPQTATDTLLGINTNPNVISVRS